MMNVANELLKRFQGMLLDIIAEPEKRHSTMVGKSNIDNLIVTDNKMVTLSINKGNDLTELISNLEAARRDKRTTETVRLWVKNGKVFVSNRFKASYCK